MKKLIIAVSLLTFTACTRPGSGIGTATSTDTTFTNGFLQITFRGRTYTVKPCSVNGQQIVQFSNGAAYISTTGGYDGLWNSFLTWNGAGSTTYPIGTFPIQSNSGGITFYSPINYTYGDVTGTVTVTHNAADYIQGTFTTEMDSSNSNINVGTATGSFQFYY